MKEQPLIYDWSKHEGPEKSVRSPVQVVKIDDETLRDGLQGAQIERPITINEKKVYVELASPFVDHFDVGYPNSHETQQKEALEIIKHGLELKLKATYSLAGRAPLIEDINPMIDISHALDGYPVRADIFFDASSRRARIEGWNREEMLKAIEENIKTLKHHGLLVMYVGEMSTSTPPNQLEESFERATQAGADVLCIADTQGIADPQAMRNLARWSMDTVGRKYSHLLWDAHCHNHLGMAVANSLVAVEEGVNEVHGTVLWLGEGPGNADNSNLLVVLELKGYLQKGLRGVTEWYNEASGLFGIPIPASAPIVGRSAHKTSSGIHARAIEKQQEKEESGAIYFPYPPEMVGAKASAEIGPASSSANVRLKLSERNIKPDEETSLEMLNEAKKTGKLLPESTINRILDKHFPKKNGHNGQ